MFLRELKVMSVIFAVVVALVGGWLGFTMIFNSPKPKTKAEHFLELTEAKNHNVSPHIPQLSNASATVTTAWREGVVDYHLTLLDARAGLDDWLKQNPTFLFTVTWFDREDKPAAKITVPFKDFHTKADDKGIVLEADGNNKISQSEYEKIWHSNSWGLSWGPEIKTNSARPKK